MSERDPDLPELREELAQLRAQLETVRRALEALPHEARTPLTGLSGMVELLLDSALSPAQRVWAESARESAQQLQGLIDDLLDYGQLDGREAPDESFDLRATLEDVLARSASKAHRNRVELSLLVDQEVPRRLVAPVARLRQVLARLIDNAVSFTHDGSVKVRVLPQRVADPDIELWLEVHDTGAGIPEHLHDSIFEPHGRVDSSADRTHQGAGLSLPLVKRIIESSGGSLGFESTPGGGSRFWFTFPASFEPSSAGPRDPLLQDRRVLVVAAEAAHRAQLQLQLQDLGMHADGASDGPAALTRLRRGAAAGRPYAACVVELKLTGMDGLALAGVMGQDPELAPLPVVLVAGRPDQLDDARLKRIALAAVLTRPLRGQTVRAAMCRALDQGAGSSERVPVAKSRATARILVAEDNPVTQRLLATTLKRLGYACDLVGNGDEAIRRFSTGRYDAVLMDVQMPGTDGLVATRRIRLEEAAKGRRRTPILAITANVSLEDRQRCLRAGMDDHVAKPFRLDELTSALSRWVMLDASMRSFSLSSEDAELQEIPTIDEEVMQGLRDTAGTDQAFGELIELYLDQLARGLSTLRDQVGSRLSPAALQRLHELEAASTMVGGRRLAVACLELRRLATNEALTGRAARLVRDVEQEARQLDAELRTRVATS